MLAIAGRVAVLATVNVVEFKEATLADARLASPVVFNVAVLTDPVTTTLFAIVTSPARFVVPTMLADARLASPVVFNVAVLTEPETTKLFETVVNPLNVAAGETIKLFPPILTLAVVPLEIIPIAVVVALVERVMLGVVATMLALNVVIPLWTVDGVMNKLFPPIVVFVVVLLPTIPMILAVELEERVRPRPVTETLFVIVVIPETFVAPVILTEAKFANPVVFNVAVLTEPETTRLFETVIRPARFVAPIMLADAKFANPVVLIVAVLVDPVTTTLFAMLTRPARFVAPETLADVRLANPVVFNVAVLVDPVTTTLFETVVNPLMLVAPVILAEAKFANPVVFNVAVLVDPETTKLFETVVNPLKVAAGVTKKLLPLIVVFDVVLLPTILIILAVELAARVIPNPVILVFPISVVLPVTLAVPATVSAKTFDIVLTPLIVVVPPRFAAPTTVNDATFVKPLVLMVETFTDPVTTTLFETVVRPL
jgi:hypothetical protein